MATVPRDCGIPSVRKTYAMNTRSRLSRGMSLLEVMSGMAILSMVSLGILAALLQSRRLTEGSIYQNTAVTAAQGYIEQMKNMEFDELAQDPIPCRLTENILDPINVSPLPRSTDTQEVNHRFVDLNTTPDNPEDDMPLDLVVYVENITDPANGIGDAKAISITYTWVVNEGSAQRSFTNTVSCIRSKVPTIP
jgi:prepilin-type N-terminal cleavage/methylation domain-containing protein